MFDQEWIGEVARKWRDRLEKSVEGGVIGRNSKKQRNARKG